LTYSGINVYFAFDENDTGFTRTTNVIITNTETLQTVEIFVTQYPRALTSDSTLTTSDTTLITVDNG
jgi:hypothetical protein